LDDLVSLSQDPDVSRYTSHFTEAEAAERIAASEREWRERGHGMMAVLRREDDAFLGRSGLRHWPEFDEVEVGWSFYPRFWGHGYATEAGRASLDFGIAELDVPYITAMIQPENLASVAVAERLGMRRGRSQLLVQFGVTVNVYVSDR
jgi:RimJ/RimL family protein N-acetyltransferase